MSVREELFTALFKELVGPRGSINEMMEDDPKEEYLAGVLEPQSFQHQGLDDYGISDTSSYVPDEEKEEDSDEPPGVFELNPLATTLHPLARPKSMGISFVISSDGRPSIDFCATWARYRKERGQWKRFPFKLIRYGVDLEKEKGPWLAKEDKEVYVVKEIASSEPGRWHVSLYLVNNTELDISQRPGTTDMVFQPQLRINAASGSKIEPVRYEKGEADEEMQLDFLYRELSAFARGHLCGATWASIDPARPTEKSDPDRLYSRLLSPDILALEEPHRSHFAVPHIRTEYLPSYATEQSTVELRDLPGLGEDDLSAFVLSDKIEPDVLALSLSKLASLYAQWIRRQEDEIKTRRDRKILSADDQRIAVGNLEKCRYSLNRMESGIALLKSDVDVRLAFLFMNRVMNTQAQWARQGKHLVWKPFQMAFILQCIEGIAGRLHSDRKICDLLWYPTGGGKTESYLGLMIFVLALRRLRKQSYGFSEEGTGVISRYTLRLLTIQQFRRTLRAITAADYLRVTDWRPKGFGSNSKGLWGSSRFSIGLWLGRGVTPNNLAAGQSFDNERKVFTRHIGALDILCYRHLQAQKPGEIISGAEGEPAQVLKCPRCSALLAIPSTPTGIPGSDHTIFWIVKSRQCPTLRADQLDYPPFRVMDVSVMNDVLPNREYYVLRVRFTTPENSIHDDKIREWWHQKVRSKAEGTLACCAASRPGYFIRKSLDVMHKDIDFEIHCPNPHCELNQVQWFESVPSKPGEDLVPPHPSFSIPSRKGYWHGVPISAFTVDDQIYTKCPSVIIATVDKFARLPFEPRSASVFGNVNIFDTIWGYGRDIVPPEPPGEKKGSVIEVQPFLPPDLIVQDELHLIEGPLGSIVGLYECAIDCLCSLQAGEQFVGPKYIASTATTRNAEPQVQSLFDRRLAQFPSPGITVTDNFFSKMKEGHPLESTNAGRLYIGVCCPGKGPQTPTYRIWASLLQEAERIRRSNGGIISEELDYFWTLVGYFNAVRELAQAAKLYREDIPSRMREPARRANLRNIEEKLPLELSSNRESVEIPSILEQLEKPGAGTDTGTDAVFATSMFGTGVDIDRLSLMVVHGQPKTTSSYIQATGRVGRKKGALVVTFLRSTRSRDLDHYEFFTGYHRALYRYVEPVSVFPFSPRACDRAIGPVSVAIIRNGSYVGKARINPEWAPEKDAAKTSGGTSGSRRMADHRYDQEIKAVVRYIMGRSERQPPERKPPTGELENHINSEFERWENIAKSQDDLFYAEPTFRHNPRHPVVLGDPSHRRSDPVFEHTPQSMREVESSTRFQGR